MTVECTTETLPAAAHEFVLDRIYHAPRALVFAAWTAPHHLAHWWGPAGFVVPVCETDPRPGGCYRIVMRSPEGTDYPLRGRYLDLEEPSLLVMTLDPSGHPPHWHAELRRHGGAAPEIVMVVLFEVQPGGTRVAIKNRFPSPADRDAFLKMGMADGWSQSLERLGARLEEMRGISVRI
jgi:uncharacterized protein YndB with AHSA1/START domain